MNSASLVIHHAATAMMIVQVHALHVELKMTNTCCSCTRVSAWHPVRVASLQTLETMNANFAMAPAEAVLGLHHLSASLVIREGFFLVVVLVYVSCIALKVSYSSACVLGCHLTTASKCNYFHQVKMFQAVRNIACNPNTKSVHYFLLPIWCHRLLWYTDTNALTSIPFCYPQ